MCVCVCVTSILWVVAFSCILPSKNFFENSFIL